MCVTDSDYVYTLPYIGFNKNRSSKTDSTIETQVVSRKKLTNHNRLFFLHLTMISQFLADYDFRLYCRPSLRLTNHNNFSEEWSGCDWLILELWFLLNLI